MKIDLESTIHSVVSTPSSIVCMESVRHFANYVLWSSLIICQLDVIVVIERVTRRLRQRQVATSGTIEIMDFIFLGRRLAKILLALRESLKCVHAISVAHLVHFDDAKISFSETISINVSYHEYH